MEIGKRFRLRYEAICRRYNIAPELFDVEAYYDGTLTEGENARAIEEEIAKLGTPPEPKESTKDLKRQADEIERQESIRVSEEKQQHLNELFNGTKERAGDADELLEEIRKFNPHSERVTLSTLMAVNQRTNVINLSSAGFGKSRGTKELLNLLNIPYTEIAGHKAPTDFFNELKVAKGIVLIDESATLLRNNEILNLLLAALWTKEIVWRDERAAVEATIIFNTNSLPKTPFMEALKDRCQFNHLKLDTKKLKEKLLSDFEYRPNMAVLEKIRNNTFMRAELTPEEVAKMKEVLSVTCPKSVRDKGRLLAQAKFAKGLFGSVDFVKLFVDISAVPAIMDSNLSRADKVKAIADAEGVNVRTARRWVSDTEGD